MFTDNYYSSPSLFESLLGVGIRATGTLRTNRVGVPSSVVALKAVLEKEKTDRGTGDYVRTSSTGYVCWKDVRVVTLISTAYLGHSEGTVSRRTSAGKVAVQVPLPVVIYNSSMGGVDKSDQYFSYHNTLRRTVRYWKTLFYHAVDIAVVNSFILYNVLAYRAGERRVSENDYRDLLVLQFIQKYGREKREPTACGRPPKSSFRIRHGSALYAEKGRCQYCKLTQKENFTQRKCPDCPFTPSLCQTMDRDCHRSSFDEIRALWFDKQEHRSTSPSAGSSQKTAPSSARSSRATSSSAGSSQTMSSQTMSSSAGSSQKTAPSSARSSRATSSSAGSPQTMSLSAGSPQTMSSSAGSCLFSWTEILSDILSNCSLSNCS